MTSADISLPCHGGGGALYKYICTYKYQKIYSGPFRQKPRIDFEFVKICVDNVAKPKFFVSAPAQAFFKVLAPAPATAKNCELNFFLLRNDLPTF
jgi:hypothetical protein